jgi:hypothetical protein
LVGRLPFQIIISTIPEGTKAKYCMDDNNMNPMPAEGDEKKEGEGNGEMDNTTPMPEQGAGM